MSHYLPVLYWLLFLSGLAAFLLALTTWLGPKRSNPVKELPFETGNLPTPGSTRERFGLQFYLLAILFVVFDVEIAFLYPWAVKFRELALLGLVEMLIFVAVLMVGWGLLVKRGVLSWK